MFSRVRILAIAAVCALVGAGLSQPALAGEASSPPRAQAAAAAPEGLAIAAAGRDGVDVIKFDQRAGTFRTLTRLWVEGWDAPSWTEYDCTTGDGKYLAVVFAPAAAANRSELRERGAFGAVVDLATGARWVIPERVALTYWSPGCGSSDNVVFSRTSDGATDLLVVDASARQLLKTVTTAAPASSVVPTATGLVGAVGNTLVSIAESGETRSLAETSGALFDVRPARNGVEFLSTSGGTTTAFRYERSGETVRLASGPRNNVRLFAGSDGNNHLVGEIHGIANGFDIITADRQPLWVSPDGSTLVTDVAIPGLTSTSDASPTVNVTSRSGATRKVDVVGQVPNTAATTNDSGSGSGSTSDAAPLFAAPAGSPCAVPKLDEQTQVIQPTPAQVEWAANRAVRGELTNSRPANWQNHGLGSYVPQNMFPLPALVGGGRIPVQVIEGLIAQESNFHQASSHALPGVASDPLVGDYYGTVYDSQGLISGMNFSNADCGYGLGQITDHMRTADPFWSADVKRAIATDYEVNVAATAWFLARLWNQLHSSPENIIANDGDANQIENWYFVLWAYNSGVQPTAQYGNTSGCTPGPACANNGHWGLGWTNNPAQNAYNPSRDPFLRDSYTDAARPANWPYQERVLGWAESPQQDPQTGGYKYTATSRLSLSTNYYLFCDSTLNNCSQTSTATGFCLSSDRTTCWWHSPRSWIAAANGTRENSQAYQAGAAEPTATNPYPPSCTATSSTVQGTPGRSLLPLNAVIVDDLSDSAHNVAGCATVARAGSFDLSWGTDTSGNPTGAIDAHQLGVGYLGHTVFTHTVNPARTHVVTTGTWTPPSTVVGWQRIWVHIPNNGADTFQADYKVFTGTTNKHRVVNQRWNQNTWFDLGSFLLSPGATVSLSNATYSDYSVGAIDIAWDAVAFSPSAKPTVSYVAFGDSYQAGEGVEPYYAAADNGASTPAHKNTCHRSPAAYPPLIFNDLRVIHPGTSTEFHFVACSGATTPTVSGSVEQSGEVPQLQQGWLDENTTHVTIGIGGNDARFAAILDGCFRTITVCTAPGYRLTIDGQAEDEPLSTKEPKVIDALGPTLQSLYLQIRNLAPNAQLVVVGYPHVITTGDRRVGIDCGGYDQDTVNWFAQMGDRLNAVTKAAAAASGGTFVSTVENFQGPPEHSACASSTAWEWINAVVAESNSGSGRKVPGSGSFHPDADGHRYGDEASIRLALH